MTDFAPYVEIILGGTAAAYIRDQLAGGNTLARSLLENHDLAAGRIVTFAPPGVPRQEMEDFEEGGKFPAPGPDIHVTDKEGLRTRIERVSFEAQAVLARAIRGFLQADERRVCVFEDFMERSVRMGLRRGVLLFNDEIYLLCKAGHQTKTIRETIWAAFSYVFHAAAIAPVAAGVSWPLAPGKLSREELMALSNTAEMIIVGAYDGEGYLIWEKVPLA